MTALERLQGGYYNSQPKTPANPGGLAGNGHVVNFPAALLDVAAAGAAAMGAAAGSATVAATKRDEAVDALGSTLEALGGAEDAASAAVYYAASALEAVASMLPERPGPNGEYYTELATGAPVAAPRVPPARLVDVDGSKAYQPTASTPVWTQGVLRNNATLTYEVEVEVEGVSNTSGQSAFVAINLAGLSATYTLQAVSSVTRVVNAGVQLRSARFAVVFPSNGAALPAGIRLRAGATLNVTTTGGALAGAVGRLRALRVRDVTAVVQAEAQAAIATTKAGEATTAAQGVTPGTGPNNIPRLDGLGRLPVLDASQLFNVPTDTTIPRDVRLLGLLLAEARGDRLNMTDGIVDPLNDLTDVGSAVGLVSYAGGLRTDVAVGASLNGQGTAFSTATGSGGSAVGGFDGNASTYWLTAAGGSAVIGACLARDFGATPRALRRVRMLNWQDDNTAPELAAVQWSDDAASWTTAASGFPVQTGNAWSQFEVDAGLHGPHRYWRLVGLSATPSGGPWTTRELEFLGPTMPAQAATSGIFPSLVASPSRARMALQISAGGFGSASLTPGTDFSGQASRDGGTNYVLFSLLLVARLADGTSLYEGEASLAAQPAGTSMRWGVNVAAGKYAEISGVVFQWRAS